jgi:hypothetical protein
VYGTQEMKREPLPSPSLVHGQANIDLHDLFVLTLAFLVMILDLKALLQSEGRLFAFELVLGKDLRYP